MKTKITKFRILLQIIMDLMKILTSLRPEMSLHILYLPLFGLFQDINASKCPTPEKHRDVEGIDEDIDEPTPINIFSRPHQGPM